MSLKEAGKIHVWLRVSRQEQNFRSQREAIYRCLEREGVPRDDKRIVEWRLKESGASSRTHDYWERLVDQVQEGDYVVAYDATRIGRPQKARAMFYIMEQISRIFRKGARLKLVNKLGDLDLDKLPDYAIPIVISVFTAVSGLELQLIKERQKAGIVRYRKEHGVWGRRPKHIPKEQLKAMLEQGMSKAAIMRQYGIRSRTTLLKIMREYGLEEYIHEQRIHRPDQAPLRGR